jgi:hypothetical protein
MHNRLSSHVVSTQTSTIRPRQGSHTCATTHKTTAKSGPLVRWGSHERCYKSITQRLQLDGWSLFSLVRAVRLLRVGLVRVEELRLKSGRNEGVKLVGAEPDA